MLSRLIVLIRHQHRYVGRHRAAADTAPPPVVAEVASREPAASAAAI